MEILKCIGILPVVIYMLSNKIAYKFFILFSVSLGYLPYSNKLWLKWVANTLRYQTLLTQSVTSPGSCYAHL